MLRGIFKVLFTGVVIALIVHMIGVRNAEKKEEVTEKDHQTITKQYVDDAKTADIHDNVISVIDEVVIENLDNEKLLNDIDYELENCKTVGERQQLLEDKSKEITDVTIQSIKELDFKGYVNSKELDVIIKDADIQPLVYNTLYDHFTDLMMGTSHKHRDEKLMTENQFGVGKDNDLFKNAMEEFDEAHSITNTSDMVETTTISLDQANKMLNDYMVKNYGSDCELNMVGSYYTEYKQAYVSKNSVTDDGMTKREDIALIQIDLATGDISVVEPMN